MKREFHITRSATNPERYWLSISELLPDGSLAESYEHSMDWRQLEVLNREIVKLRAEDTIRYAEQDAAEGQWERDQMRDPRA